MPSTTTVVTVTDREGDIYELFAVSFGIPIALLIERYHYVLKSGCRIEREGCWGFPSIPNRVVEHLQLETAERIKKALAKRCHCRLAITLAHEPKRGKILSFLAIRS